MEFRLRVTSFLIIIPIFNSTDVYTYLHFQCIEFRYAGDRFEIIIYIANKKLLRIENLILQHAYHIDDSEY